MLDNNVNNKQSKKIQHYYHCFKLNDTFYALFDIKMDMPMIVGSLSIVMSTKIPKDSLVYYYKLNGAGFFEKGPKRTIEIDGEVLQKKFPLRYKRIDDAQIYYHHFKINNVLSAFFDSDLEMPIMYGSNDKIQNIKNKLDKTKQIFVYKEDAIYKNSFKLWRVETGDKR